MSPRTLAITGVLAVLSLSAAARADDVPEAAATARRDEVVPSPRDPANVRESTADAVASPSVVGDAAVLTHDAAGVDVATSVRLRTAGSSVIGSELDVRISLSRREGRLALIADGMVRRAVGTRDDVDAQGSMSALFKVGAANGGSPRGGELGGLTVGAEGRVRGEVVDGVVAADDTGRPVEIVAGATAGVDVGRMRLRSLAGFCWPRGPAPAGAALLGGMSFTF
jgi:hypothetical protein